VEHYAELRPVIDGVLRSRTRSEWNTVLKSAGIPCGGVRDIAEVLADPQLEARTMIEEVEHAVAGAVRVLGLPVKLSATPGAIRRPPPALGEHTAAILAELGLGDSH
jgi:crotonobetainyl-CoA:carnitine CoA-transferase CaiB-like acyl-CoA transferase